MVLVSCGGGMLPSNPKITEVYGSEDANGIYVHWYSIEGADSFVVFGIDSSVLHRITSTSDTSVLIRRPYKNYLVYAYAPSDSRASDTINIEPYSSDLEVFSYGSGNFSGVCFADSLYLCNPEDGDEQPKLLFVLDSLKLISPSENSDKFGQRITQFKPFTGSFPVPPNGYTRSMSINIGDTVALWIDLGIENEFDKVDILGKITVDSILFGDYTRDSIKVYMSVWYHRISRLKWLLY